MYVNNIIHKQQSKDSFSYFRNCWVMKVCQLIVCETDDSAPRHADVSLSGFIFRLSVHCGHMTKLLLIRQYCCSSSLPVIHLNLEETVHPLTSDLTFHHARYLSCIYIYCALQLDKGRCRVGDNSS